MRFHNSTMFLCSKIKKDSKMTESRRRNMKVHFSSDKPRPMSDQGPMFRNSPGPNESTDCIWITDDMLNEFKCRVLKSHKVDLHFSSTFNYLSRTHYKLPPLYKERLLQLHEKATFRLRGGHVQQQSTGPQGKSARSMDSGEDVGDLSDDIIDTVAKANSVPLEPSSVLPEIRASPCQIHSKRIRGKGQEVLYHTNSHIKEINSPRKWDPNPIKKVTIQPASPERLRTSNRFDLDIRIPHGQHGSHPLKQPALPKQLSSKDYVMTWLIHGSAPGGTNHFPNIVQGGKKGQSIRPLQRKSDMSE